MNLFTRLSEILDGDEPAERRLPFHSRSKAEQLVRSLEKHEARVRQSAVTVITAERAVARELDRARRCKQPDRVLLERLMEEYGQAMTIKAWLKQTLHDLRAGLWQARSFRATIRRWECVAALRQASAQRRLFWKAYCRLCDVADEKMDTLEQDSSLLSIGAYTSQSSAGSGQ